MSKTSKPSLATTVAGIHLDCCIYNASGPRTGSSAALTKIANSESGAVLSKSATLESQKGNPLPRTWHEEKEDGTSTASLNSEGLPNSGIDYYISSQTISETMMMMMMSSSAADKTIINKPYIVSISGHTLADNMKMLQQIADAANTDHRISAVELNLACPNIIGKPIIGYDFDQMDEVLSTVSTLTSYHRQQQQQQQSDDNNKKRHIPLGVKLPPYFDFIHHITAANLLNRYKHCIHYIATINTIGNNLSIDLISETPTLSSNSGYAGLSGPAIKYAALANVRKMRELLDDDIDVVGVGGIQNGEDVMEMILCGAKAVQVGTCHWKEGPGCFDRIAEELRGLLVKGGYDGVEEVRGKLKDWSKEGAKVSREVRKKKKQEKVEGKVGGGGGGGQGVEELGRLDGQMILSAVLALAVAVLLADKLGVVHI